MYLTLPIATPVQVMIVLCTVILCGCMSFEEGWKQFKKPTKTGDVAELLKKAQDQTDEADTKEKVLQLVKTYESVLEIDPYNYEALKKLGGWLAFLGMYYADSIEEKKNRLLDAVKYNEQAMYTNPEFKDLVDKGASVWDAYKVLTTREVPPMFYWWAAGAGYWKECLNRTSRLINFIHPLRGKKILERMLEIDPSWDGGHPYYAWAVRYSALPRLLGGDLEKAEEFFDKAIEAGPNWLYIRHGRAKYLHTKKKDRKAFREDLQWVIEQDPHKADSPYPANVLFQKEAKEMLANIDDYF